MIAGFCIIYRIHEAFQAVFKLFVPLSRGLAEPGFAAAASSSSVAASLSLAG